jgi:hypothetical protein
LPIQNLSNKQPKKGKGNKKKIIQKKGEENGKKSEGEE